MTSTYTGTLLVLEKLTTDIIFSMIQFMGNWYNYSCSTYNRWYYCIKKETDNDKWYFLEEISTTNPDKKCDVLIWYLKSSP